MPLPRPASPRMLWLDLKAFWGERPRHQYAAAILAVLIPIVILVGFWLDSQTNIRPPEQIIYMDSWSAARTDDEIKAKQKADLIEKRAFQAERQRQFKRLDDRLERLGI